LDERLETLAGYLRSSSEGLRKRHRACSNAQCGCGPAAL